MTATCVHCKNTLAVGAASDFCCPGCAAAYQFAQGLKLEDCYEYSRAIIQQNTMLAAENHLHYDNFIEKNADNYKIYLLIENMRCGACVWLIENTLQKQPGVTNARLNLSTKRLTLEWHSQVNDINALVAVLSDIGYRAIPFSQEKVRSREQEYQKKLLKCLTVAAACSLQVMMLAFAIWAGTIQGSIGPQTTLLFNILIAAIAVPAIAYSGMPFFKSAYQAVRNKRTNMDVPIAFGVIATTMMSINETLQSHTYTYYDAAIGLIFVLLIGRYLDLRARNSAGSLIQNLLLNQPTAVTIFEDGKCKLLGIKDVKIGQVAYIAAGERISVDGVILEGESEVDNSIITGESLPCKVSAGSFVSAGSVNLSDVLKVEITGAGESTTLSEVLRLIEYASQLRSRYVVLADKIASYYTPTVFTAAILTFTIWHFLMNATLSQAILHAVSVLIITCPCALGLAAPIVQVVSVLRLMKRGILVKTQDALERFATVTDIVFDKTGTLTQGTPTWLNKDQFQTEAMLIIASMASRSKHHLMRAVAQDCKSLTLLEIETHEKQGLGLRAHYNGTEILLGSKEWCNVRSADVDDYLEVWFCYKGEAQRLIFEDAIKKEAGNAIHALKENGYRLHLFSGDRESAVATVANKIGIEYYYGLLKPADKYNKIEQMRLEGRKVLMIGDGLNDSPALQLSDASMAPSSALGIALSNADMIFQNSLHDILYSLKLSKNAMRLMKQNFVMSFAYNIVAVPIAMLGILTPLIAAVAMATSSLTVVLNALRLNLKNK